MLRFSWLPRPSGFTSTQIPTPLILPLKDYLLDCILFFISAGLHCSSLNYGRSLSYFVLPSLLQDTAVVPVTGDFGYGRILLEIIPIFKEFPTTSGWSSDSVNRTCKALLDLASALLTSLTLG